MISIALLAGGVSAFSPGVKSPLAPVVQARTLSPYAQMYPDAVPGARAPPEKSAAARAARRAAAAGQGPGPGAGPGRVLLKIIEFILKLLHMTRNEVK